MKKILQIIGVLYFSFVLPAYLHSQNIAINLSGAPSANLSAILDMSDASNNKLGLLLPNVSLSAVNSITPFTSTPATGLIVWNTNAAMVGGFGAGFYYYTGTQWNYLQNSGNTNWLTGTGTNNYTARWTSATNLAIGVIQDNGTGAGISATAITPKSMLDVEGGVSIGTYAGVTAAPANGMIISGQVGIGNNSPNASASLDLSNTSNLAFLPPQVSLSNIGTLAPVPGPGTPGLIVYNTNAATVGGSGTGLYYWNGSQWNYLSAGGASGWSTTGNTGTNPAINYAGTSGAQDFVVRTTATERMRFLAGGGAGIGTTTPKSAMDVNGNVSFGAYAGVAAAPANGMIISGQIGVGTTTPNASAVLDLTSSTAGFLPPRMTATQMNAIASPAIGLMVLNSTTNCIEYWGGAAWMNVACPCTSTPATPGTITGNATPCASSAGNVYSIAAVAGATSYTWTVPAGATITAGLGTTSITVTFGTTSGNITVAAVNSCGTSTANTLTINLATTPSAPNTPSGTTAPSISSSSTYTIPAVVGATSYTWSVSTTNGSVTGGQGTTSATITFSSTAATMNICVYASNACGNSSPTCLSVTSTSCTHGSITFNYTGNLQTWAIPGCISSITITAYGAQGGGANAGNGGQAIATIPVTGGTTLDVYVGGTPTTQIGAGGYNGGGASTVAPCGGPPNDGYPGGGASDVRVSPYGLGNRIIVAAGGGGQGYSSGTGGAGGGLNGNPAINSFVANSQGLGASQAAGGAGGYYSSYTPAASGTLGQGGAADTYTGLCSGGGGGGGYYGGGGGFTSAGGGGSSYISYPGSTSTSTSTGVNSGNGSITIQY